jgi:hypothetical protein
MRVDFVMIVILLSLSWKFPLPQSYEDRPNNVRGDSGVSYQVN